MKKTLYIIIALAATSCSKELSRECGKITAASPTSITVNGKVIPVHNGSFTDLMGRTVLFYKVGDTYCK